MFMLDALCVARILGAVLWRFLKRVTWAGANASASRMLRD